MYTKPLVTVTTENGCYVPISHKLNADGYFRKRWANTLEMFHRFIWRAHNGDIPEGYEINHLCGCRSCCNVKHLECIPGQEHTIKTNKERYVDRQQLMVRLIEEGKTIDEMVQVSGETRDAVYRYCRRYRQGKLSKIQDVKHGEEAY
jgi:hypothetical protein